MNREHYLHFAQIARQHRLNAKTHEKAGDKVLADCSIFQALGIEQAVLDVAKRFHSTLNEVRFRQACNPDLPLTL